MKPEIKIEPKDILEAAIRDFYADFDRLPDMTDYKDVNIFSALFASTAQIWRIRATEQSKPALRAHWELE